MLRAVKVGLEKRDDAPTGVSSGRLVVADSDDLEHLEQNIVVVIEEGVPGVGIFKLQVLGDAG